MRIYSNPNNQKIIYELIDTKTSIGQSRIILGSSDNNMTYEGFLLIKCSKRLIKGYHMYQKFIRNYDLSKKHQLEILPEIVNSTKRYKVKWKSFKSISYPSNTLCHVDNGKINWNFRVLASTGIVNNLKIRYCRISELWNFNGTEISSYHKKDIIFDENANLCSKVPKSCYNLRDKTIENDRLLRNALSRSNYQNNKYVKLFEEAKKSNDYSKLSPKDIFKIKNSAIRSDLLEYFGIKKVLNSFDNEIVDKNEINGNKYELLRFKFPDPLDPKNEIPATYLKMINPSTGEYHIEGVPNNKAGNSWIRKIDMNTVTDALRWRDGDNMYYSPPIAIT